MLSSVLGVLLVVGSILVAGLLALWYESRRSGGLHRVNKGGEW